MKQFGFVCLASLWLQLAFCQTQIAGTDALHYSVMSGADEIDYLKIGTDTSVARPILLFLQGSLPIPLVIDFEDFKHVNLPFQAEKITAQFHLIIISMPHTPVLVSHDQLNEQYSFITDSTNAHSYSENYLRDNVLTKYVERTHAVIDDVLDKSWVGREIHVVGHSQGAKVGCILASEDARVTTVSLLGFNPYGRYDELVRRERVALQSGWISGEQYRENTRKLYEDWREILADPTNYRAGHNAWVSFSIDYRPFLLKIEKPIFVGFGTEDVSAANCDLLPLDFIRVGKQNLTLRAYPGYDHNFFAIDKRSEGPYWNEVMTDVVDWILQNR